MIDDSIYEEGCYFADPTIAFTGLRLWKRNLQLLVPFLIDPQIELLGIQSSGKDSDERQTLKVSSSRQLQC